MAYYTKKTDRMNLHIEEGRGTILIKQKWKYVWSNDVGTTAWTISEKRSFHNKIDRLIWSSWGNHFFLKATGSSDFVKKHKKIRWDVNFDIQWVTSDEHWVAHVKKIPSGDFATSSVTWSTRIIKLDTNDVKKVKRTKASKDYFQYPVVHEFGHASGNSKFAKKGMHGDEYKAKSKYNFDTSSLMNIGSSLRNRHLDYIIEQLNTMLPNTKFVIQ